MLRPLRFLVFLLVTTSWAVAQDVPIDSIQFTTDPSGNSPLVGQVVFTGGLVTAIGYQSQPIYYFIADRPGGLWSGIYVRDTQDRQLAIGDSVRFQATVQESNSQTRLNNPTSFTRVPQSGTVPPFVVSTGSIGEPAEGVLIEFRQVIVTDTAGAGFRVDDGSGPASIGTGWNYAYDPLPGDTLVYLRGIVTSSNNVFTVNPRGDMDFGFFGNRPPLISEVHNYPATPTTVQPDTIVATVFDEDGIQGVSVFYRFGETGEFVSRTMNDLGVDGDHTAGDGIFTGVIPAAGSSFQHMLAHYYIRATDVPGAESFSPAGAPNSTYSFLIRSENLTIFDIQYTGNPTGGDSPYNGQTVTITGIVTGSGYSSYTDGYFISDPGGGLWGGLQVYNPQSTPALGDCVRVTCQISEYNGLTETAAGATATVLGSGTIPEPLAMRFTQLADSGEPFEGTLARIEAPMVVTDINSWSQYRQFSLRSGSATAAAVGDFSYASSDFDYVPVVGDSILWLTGCVTYNSNVGWMIAPRTDLDIGYVDNRAPQLTSAGAVAERDVNVRFSEALDSTGISALSNYQVIDLSDTTNPVLAIESAYLFTDRRTLHLVMLATLDEGRAYRLTIGRVRDLAGNPLDNAAVSFGGYEPQSFTPIDSLYRNFAVYNGATITLRGIVNFVQDVTTTSGSRRISAFMQDESGYGFSLSQSGAAATYPGIQRGNFITITGVANVYSGTIQLGSFTASSVTVLAEHVPLPQPIVVRTGDYRLQRNIVNTSLSDAWGAGTWVQTTGVIYRVDENVGGGTNIAIDDGSGNLTIRVWDSMNLDSVNLHGTWFLMRDLRGKTVTIAGPSSTYNGDFQMLAGYAEDVFAQTTDIGPSAAAWLKTDTRPFAPDLGQTFKIEYNAPALAQVRLRIYDLRGRLVSTLRDKAAGGPEIIVWDGRTELRELVPIGTYILHLECVLGGKTTDVVKPIVVGTKL